MKLAGRIVTWVLALAALVLAFWMVMIGPVAVWRVISHGTTTVWDHTEYPGRELGPSPDPQPWPVAAEPIAPPQVTLDGGQATLDQVLAEHDTLSFLVVADGEIVYEWYALDHGPTTPSMLFSVSKLLFSLMAGAAVEDGLLNTTDPVMKWVPELEDFGDLPSLLTMRSGSGYVENDNPFGVHVEFNYTDDLEADILGLTADQEHTFRYKSGDYAVASLALESALGDRTLTDYMTQRLWDPLGAITPGIWSTDHEDGLERVWCCLAMTARDLARFGQLVADGGVWDGTQLVPEAWIDVSLTPATPQAEWDADPDNLGSPFTNYGYGWWLTDDAAVGFGKDGQYLYVDPERRVVIVRLGESQGGIGWTGILSEVAEAATG